MVPEHLAEVERLAEVWGDVVDLRHLALAVAIGAAVSLGVFLAALAGFHALGTVAASARAYAMLAGLCGCVLGGAICARLLPPKRILVETGGSEDERAAAVAALFEGRAGEGETIPLPAVAHDELQALGLLDLMTASARRVGSA